MKPVLSIAGSDCSGGAGIQADLKTMCALGVYGMTVVTAITAQNTLTVSGIQEVTPEMVSRQLDAVWEDIPPAAVKIGMLANARIVETVRERLTTFGATTIVLDPVMVSKGGAALLDTEAERELAASMALATLVTPNMNEAARLTGTTVRTREDMLAAARAIRRQGAANVLVKGGLLEDGADDLLLEGDKESWFRSPRVPTRNVQGTGCSLSSAIACYLAHGCPLWEAVSKAKAFVYQALTDAPALGHGVGPIGHLRHLYHQAGLRW